MMRGGTPATAAPMMRARGLRLYFFSAASLAISSAHEPSLTPDALPAVTVPSGLTTPLRPASASSVVARGCSSVVNCGRLAFLLAGDRHRHGLAFEEAGLVRGLPALLRAQREGILVGARHLEFGGHVLGRLGHRVDAVLLLHQRIDEAPADGGVFDLHAARERAVGLGHHERRARHALHAAGDHQLGLAGCDRARAHRHRVEAGAAQAVDAWRRPPRWAGRRAARPCARRCGCLRRRRWRSRRSRRRRPSSRRRRCAASAP